jgi:hypothetical protein
MSSLVRRVRPNTIVLNRISTWPYTFAVTLPEEPLRFVSLPNKKPYVLLRAAALQNH